tara:strand:- start:88 stop:297 length:210 start_codon:yes stop_codon:yes gene_type:complete
METWRYTVLFTFIFLVTVVPAIIGMYWLLYIYPYDKIRRQQNEETEKSDESDEEPEWVDNPIHVSETNI